MIVTRPDTCPRAGSVRGLRLLCALALTAWIGLYGVAGWPGHEVSAASLESAYSPVFAVALAPAQRADRGTLRGDFEWAAGAATLEEARERWQSFLAHHDPADGVYEDNFHAMHAATARYELARVFYLLGDAASGDAYLRQADPLDLR